MRVLVTGGKPAIDGEPQYSVLDTLYAPSITLQNKYKEEDNESTNNFGGYYSRSMRGVANFVGACVW